MDLDMNETQLAPIDPICILPTKRIKWLNESIRVNCLQKKTKYSRLPAKSALDNIHLK